MKLTRRHAFGQLTPTRHLRAACRVARALVVVAVGALYAGAASPAFAQAQLAKGPYVTGVTSTSAQVRAEANRDEPMTLEVRPFGDAKAAPVVVTDSAAHTGPRVLTATKLAPDVRYKYSLKAGAAVAEGEFATAPADDREFTFLAYGDNRTDDAAHASIVAAMRDAPGSFLVHTGDFVPVGSNPEDWQKFFAIESSLLRTRAIYTAVGNHELRERGGREYLEFFGDPTFNYAGGKGALPQLNSTSRWGNTRFFYLNAMTDWKSGADREWLETELNKAANEPGISWRIAVMHHSLFSAGPHGDNVKMLEAGIPALFKSKGIDLLLAGHDHLYERGYGEGVRYIITGGGGAPLYEIRGKRPSTRVVESVRHFVAITVKPTGIRATVKRLDGSLLENCGFAKGASDWDCDAAAPSADLLAAAATSPHVAGVGTSAAASAGSPANSAPERKSHCACDSPASQPTSGAASIAIAALVASAIARRRRTLGRSA